MLYEHLGEGLDFFRDDMMTGEIARDPVCFPHHPTQPNLIYDRSFVAELFKGVAKDREDLYLLEWYVYNSTAIQGIQLNPRVRELINATLDRITIEEILSPAVSITIDGGGVLSNSQRLGHAIRLYYKVLTDLKKKMQKFLTEQAECPKTREIISKDDMKSAKLFRDVFLVAAMRFLRTTTAHTGKPAAIELKKACDLLSPSEVALANEALIALTQGKESGLSQVQVRKLMEWRIPSLSINDILTRYPHHCMRVIERISGNHRLVFLTRSAEGVRLFDFDLKGDGCQELLPGPSWSDGNGWNVPEYSSTVRVAIIQVAKGNEQLLLLGRAGNGLHLHCYDPRRNLWHELRSNPIFTDQNGFNQPCYYSTFRTEVLRDLTGQEQLVVIARAATGIRVSRFDLVQNAWSQLAPGPAWSDSEGWSQESQYSTLRTLVIRRANGEEDLVVLGRGKDGIRLAVFNSGRNVWTELPQGPNWSDANGFSQKLYYATIRAEVMRDAEGQNQLVLIARASAGIRLYAFNFGTNTWRNLGSGPEWSDKNGWSDERYYSTIRTEVIKGGGQNLQNGSQRDQLLISAVSGSGVRSSVYDLLNNRWLGIDADPTFAAHRGDPLQNVVLKQLEMEHRARNSKPVLLYQDSLLQRERNHSNHSISTTGSVPLRHTSLAATNQVIR